MTEHEHTKKVSRNGSHKKVGGISIEALSNSQSGPSLQSQLPGTRLSTIQTPGVNHKAGSSALISQPTINSGANQNKFEHEMFGNQYAVLKQSRVNLLTEQTEDAPDFPQATGVRNHLEMRVNEQIYAQ